MGYFLDYELFQPCWHCGRTDCNGNHPELKNVRISQEQFNREQAEYFRAKEEKERREREGAG
jgi:hypothetical protein